MKTTVVLALLLPLLLPGCVAAWGRSYDIDAESPDMVVLKYDSHFTSAADMARVARRECARYGRTPRFFAHSHSLWQIETVTYGCTAAGGRP